MASGITREEMLRQINSPEFNTRCNNYFYTNVKNIPSVIHDIERESIITNYHIFKYENQIGDNKRKNIIVDLSKVNVEELLNKAFELFQRPERVLFRNITDVTKLIDLLRKLRKNVQYVFYNAGTLSYEDVKHLNDLIYLTSYYMNEVILFQPGEDLVTYQINNYDRVLDSREHYNKIKLK